MILALQGLAGKFLISYEFNTEFIKLVTTKEAIQLIFTEEIPKECNVLINLYSWTWWIDNQRITSLDIIIYGEKSIFLF